MVSVGLEYDVVIIYYWGLFEMLISFMLYGIFFFVRVSIILCEKGFVEVKVFI